MVSWVYQLVTSVWVVDLAWDRRVTLVVVVGLSCLVVVDLEDHFVVDEA